MTGPKRRTEPTTARSAGNGTAGGLLHRLRNRLRPRHPAPVPPGTEYATATGLRVALGGRRVLNGIDLDVRTGEVLALVGPNGAGKSTLLSALAADLAPDAGRVVIDDAPASDWNPAELALRRAVLPQQSRLAFPFSVTEVVAMGRSPWAGTPAAAQDAAVVAETLRQCEIEEFAHRSFLELSGGERARVALARVLAQRAAMLLLDEPTAALDLRHQELVLRLCRDRAGAGDAVVVVLHDLGLAAAHCDRIAIVTEGGITGIGAPETVLDADLLTRVYRQPVDVLPDPRGGGLLVLARHQDAM